MAKKRRKKTNSKKQDDLKKIEGIGPKIEQLLKQEGIDSFAKLSRSSLKRLHQILEKAGPRFQIHDPKTWKEQASLAKAGNWDKLTELQDELIGGRRAEDPDSSHAPSDNSCLNVATVLFAGVEGGDYEPGQPFVVQRILSPDEEIQEYRARQEELDHQFTKAEKCADALWKKLQQLDEFEDHIAGVSVRFRTKYGRAISPLRVVVAVNVVKKLTDAELQSLGFTSIEDCCTTLPKSQQFETKVLEGEFHLLDGQEGRFLRGTRRPKNAIPFGRTVVGGIPIHRPADTLSSFGTLGLVSIANGRAAMGLTAQHVVGTDSTVEQIDDEGNDRKIGDVQNVQVAPFNVSVGGIIESIDAAHVELLGNVQSIKIPNVGEWMRGLTHRPEDEPPASNSPKVYLSNRRIKAADKGRIVATFGVGSGRVSAGKIDSINQSTSILGNAYQKNFSVEPYPNSNSPFIEPGDSGAMVVAGTSTVNGTAESALVIIGIMFAGLEDTTTGVACNMNAVIKGLNLTQQLAGTEIANEWT